MLTGRILAACVAYATSRPPNPVDGEILSPVPNWPFASTEMAVVTFGQGRVTAGNESRKQVSARKSPHSRCPSAEGNVVSQRFKREHKSNRVKRCVNGILVARIAVRVERRQRQRRRTAGDLPEHRDRGALAAHRFPIRPQAPPCCQVRGRGLNATKNPKAETVGLRLGPFPGSPPVVAEIRVVDGVHPSPVRDCCCTYRADKHASHCRRRNQQQAADTAAAHYSNGVSPCESL